MFVHASSVSLSTHQIRFAGIIQYGSGIVQVLPLHHQRDSTGHGAIDAAADPAEVFIRAKALDSSRLQPPPRKQKLLFHQELSHQAQFRLWFGKHELNSDTKQDATLFKLLGTPRVTRITACKSARGTILLRYGLSY